MTRIGSLASGYGGLDMAVEQVTGGSVAWFCEHDKGPSKILAHHWPDVPNYGDVRATDWTQVEPVDVLTAGYPCQPFSHAGNRKGTDDPRHLWPAVADAVRALRPRLCVFENVGGHLSMGLGDVLGGLAAMGYDARWGCVRAADAGAPHGRLRVFVVAEPAADAADLGHERLGRAWGRGAGPADSGGAAGAWGDYAPAIRRWGRILGRPAPAPTEPGRNGPRLSPRFVEWMMGLPAGHVTDVPGLARNAQLKALGNGVVPQQAALALSMLGVARLEAAA